MVELSISDLEAELKTAREQKDRMGELRTLKSLGSIFQKNRRFTKAASCFSKALNLVMESSGDQELAHSRLGCVYWEMAQLKKAMAHFQSALEIQQQFQPAPGQAGILALMGISCWRQCQWEPGLAYFREVLELPQNLPSTTANTAEDDYYFLSEAMERGVVTLQNRVRLGREGDPLKILQPLFAMIPLYLFTAKKNEIEPLLQEATSLAEQLLKKDIQDAIPKLRALVAKG
jgi:tetratricopeptide (TPR) repeat protein